MSKHIYEAKTVTLNERELQLIELGLDVGMFECQIDENDLDVKSIVEKLGLKKSTFNRLFPEEYARESMIEMAEQRLGWWDNPLHDNPHKDIVDKYNSRLKYLNMLPRGYRVTLEDSWACIFVSVVALDASRCEKVVPMECSCTHQVDLFKKQGLWRTRDYIPKPADFVYFNWSFEDDTAHHVGIVVEVHDDYLITIEGNHNGRVERVKRPINSHILGYGVPAYDKIYEV